MRLDSYLFAIKKYPSRTKACEAIERGDVTVNGKVIQKPSYDVLDVDNVVINESGQTFVSNGGYKLEKAFEDFSFPCKDMIFADVGASTGGFTDCLLKRGVKKVFAIDVGESLLSDELKSNEKVVVFDNFNARNLTSTTLGELVDGVVCDISFISVTYVLPQIYSILKDDGFAVILIKPQFECGKKSLNKNGIVTDKKSRFSAVKKVIDFAIEVGFYPEKFTNAPIKQDKNKEYLLLINKRQSKILNSSKIENVI